MTETKLAELALFVDIDSVKELRSLKGVVNFDDWFVLMLNIHLMQSIISIGVELEKAKLK